MQYIFCIFCEPWYITDLFSHRVLNFEHNWKQKHKQNCFFFIFKHFQQKSQILYFFLNLNFLNYVHKTETKTEIGGPLNDPYPVCIIFKAKNSQKKSALAKENFWFFASWQKAFGNKKKTVGSGWRRRESLEVFQTVADCSSRSNQVVS